MHRSLKLDCASVPCPEPLLKTIAAAAKLNVGDCLRVLVSSEAAQEDIKRWANRSPHFKTKSSRYEGRIVISLTRIE